MSRLMVFCFAIFLIPAPTSWAQNPILTLTDCETLTGWGCCAQIVPDAQEGQKAIRADMPGNETGFLSFDFQNTGLDISAKKSISFWWKTEGPGLLDLKIKIRNYPLVGGMKPVYTIWSGQSPPEGWQLASVDLANPQFDTWGGPPDQIRRYITFRTVTNSAVQLFVNHIVATHETFQYETGDHTVVLTPIAAFDFDGDAAIGFGDFILFAQHFGSQPGDATYEVLYDLDKDGQVGFGDFIAFSQNFGSNGTGWQLPLVINNLTENPLELTLGTDNTTLATQTHPPGSHAVLLTLPPNSIKNRDPADSFPFPIWIQVSSFIQTPQSSVSYIPQTGTSRTYQQFVEASKAGTEPVLPDFSYSGYHYFSKPVPDVSSDIFDVTQYGAIPNDGGSDQLAIQRAIDAAERNNGGIVFFPPGEFLVNTDDDNNQSITIRHSFIILRGSGSRDGGTIIRQVNFMPPTNPDQLWTSPYMFRFQPLNTRDPVLAKITASSARETFLLTVDDASKLRAGQWITLYMNSVSAISEFFAPYQSETS